MVPPSGTVGLAVPPPAVVTKSAANPFSKKSRAARDINKADRPASRPPLWADVVRNCGVASPPKCKEDGRGPARGKATGPAPVQIPGAGLRDEPPRIFTADGADCQKVVVWLDLARVAALAMKSGGWLRGRTERVLKAAGGDFTIIRSRIVGCGRDARFELLFQSSQQRDAALAVLAAKGAGVYGHSCHVVAGRSFDERAQRRSSQGDSAGRRGAARGLLAEGSRPVRPGGAGGVMRLGTWNADGLTALKTSEVASFMRQHRIGAMAISETHHKEGRAPPRVAGYVWFGRPRQEAGVGARATQRGALRKFQGIGLLVEKSMAANCVRLADPAYTDALWIKFPKGTVAPFGSDSGRKKVLVADLCVGACYLSPSHRANVWQSALREFFDTAKVHRAAGSEVVLLGDFNVRMAPDHRVVPPAGDDSDGSDVEEAPVCGPNARYLKASLRSRDKRFALGLADCRMVSLYGWGSGNETTWHLRGVTTPTSTTPDHICVTQGLCLGSPPTLVTDHNADLGSDHSPIYAELRAILVAHNPRGRAVVQREPAFSLKRLGTQEARRNYLEEMLEAFGDFEAQASVEATAAELVGTLERVVTKHAGPRRKVDPRDSRPRPPPWLTPVVRRAIAARRQAFRRAQQDTAGGARAPGHRLLLEYQKCSLAARKAAAIARRESWASRMRLINESRTSNPRFFYEQVKNLLPGQGCLPQMGSVVDPTTGQLAHPGDPEHVEAVRNHYVTLGNDPFRRGGVVIPEPAGFPPDSPLPPVLAGLNDRFSQREVEAGLRSTKLHKAAGPDGLKPEFFVWALKALSAPLTALFNQMFGAGSVPSNWGQTLIVSLFKKGVKSDLGNYRGLSLLNIIEKLYGRVCDNRISKCMEAAGKLAPEQNGFRRARGCYDNIFALSEALREARGNGLEYWVAFVDIRKAFDRVHRRYLWWKLQQLGVQGEMLNSLRALYATHEGRVLVNGFLSERFGITVGTKQGDTISPTLFACYINDLATVLKASDDWGILLPATKKRFHCLLLADDLVFVAASAARLQEMLSAVDTWGEQWRLEFGVSKCGVLHPRDSDGALKPAANIPVFQMQGEAVPLVASYTYLGIPFRHDLDWSEAIATRVAAANKALARVRPILLQGGLSVATKLAIVRAFVTSTALYASEFWCTGLTSMRPVAAVVNRALQLALRAPRRCPMLAMYAEVGMLPLHLQALRRRIACFQKWDQHPVSEWPSYILARGKRGLGAGRQSWLSLTGSLSRGIGWNLHQHTALVGDSSLAELLRAAARKQLHADAATRPALHKYAQLYAGELAFVGQPYLVGGGAERLDQFGVTRLFRMRSGCTALAKYLFAWGATGCESPACRACRSAPDEDRVHFALVCPGWRTQRSEWLQSVGKLSKDSTAHGKDLLECLRGVGGSERLAILTSAEYPAGNPAGLSPRCSERVTRAMSAVGVEVQGLACHGLGSMVRARLSSMRALYQTVEPMASRAKAHIDRPP